jgi:hypothetical protein
MFANRKRVLVLVALSMAVGGCELLVEFDRTKIDGGSLDGSFTDVPQNDVTTDTTNDVVNDVVNDVGTDAGQDALADADSGTGSDASDGSTADVDDGSTNDSASDAADE